MDEITGPVPPPAAPAAWPPPRPRPRAAPALRQSSIAARQQDYLKQDAWVTEEHTQFVQATAAALKAQRKRSLPEGSRSGGYPPPGPNTVFRLALDVLAELRDVMDGHGGDEDAIRVALLAAVRGLR